MLRVVELSTTYQAKATGLAVSVDHDIGQGRGPLAYDLMGETKTVLAI